MCAAPATGIISPYMAKLTVSGILALVFLLLGLTFSVVGLVVDEPDRGSPDGFVATGGALLVAGLLCATAFAALYRRHARRRRRQGPRAQAEIVSAILRPYVRVGALLTYDLTVRIPAAGEVTQRVLVVPGTDLTEGGLIEVAYDPREPSNFEPNPRKKPT